ncbi:hypothetical protein E2C01_035122 [Portunus trituberculatus]|uniref:Uncharacterized protein n=1 Tax=Portunus trituberculatus TaxID=210409 RepID=A0A5B7F7H2_PORTR|nr:hypothetical protein [Portunus trituberculatus]
MSVTHHQESPHIYHHYRHTQPHHHLITIILTSPQHHPTWRRHCSRHTSLPHHYTTSPTTFALPKYSRSPHPSFTLPVLPSSLSLSLPQPPPSPSRAPSPTLPFGGTQVDGSH